MTLREKKTLEFERGNTRSHSVKAMDLSKDRLCNAINHSSALPICCISARVNVKLAVVPVHTMKTLRKSRV
jgi:hypothetical protein